MAVKTTHFRPLGLTPFNPANSDALHLIISGVTGKKNNTVFRKDFACPVFTNAPIPIFPAMKLLYLISCVSGLGSHYD